MHSVSQELDSLLNRLDPETASLLEQAVRDAAALAVKRTAVDNAVDQLGYPAGYFESTAGSFADEPLTAPGELPFESRESW